MAFDLCRIVPERVVSLPTYWGVLVQWGGTYPSYLGITTESAPPCPVPHVSWITLLLTGRVLPASEKAMVRHGATPQQLRKFLVAFRKAVLRMSSTTHPPQLRNRGDWVRTGHMLVVLASASGATITPLALHFRHVRLCARKAHSATGVR